jgi:hypothetical protein
MSSGDRPGACLSSQALPRRSPRALLVATDTVRPHQAAAPVVAALAIWYWMPAARGVTG